MPDICHELVIGASAETIYNAITSQEGLSAWWTPDTRAEPKLNSVLRFGFGPEYFKEMKITELKPLQQVTWFCIRGAEEWVGTTISFELRSGDKENMLDTNSELKDQLQQQNETKGTVLVFHHENWIDYTSMFAECSYTWAQFLRSLKLLCETGKGRPWPNQHSVT